MNRFKDMADAILDIKTEDGFIRLLNVSNEIMGSGWTQVPGTKDFVMKFADGSLLEDGSMFSASSAILIVLVGIAEQQYGLHYDYEKDPAFIKAQKHLYHLQARGEIRGL